MRETLIGMINSITRENCEITDDTNLLFDGILDSIGIAELVFKIEEEYGIEINGDDIDPDVFKDLNSIIIMINKYLK